MKAEQKLQDQVKRLQRAREHAGYKSARMAALRHGWKYPTYAAHELGARGLTPAIAAKYGAAFSVHPEFLLFGSRPPDWWEAQPGDELRPVEKPIRLVWVFGPEGIQDGHVEIPMEQRGRLQLQLPFIDDHRLPAGAFALEIKNDEMNPRVPVAGECSLAPGDMVVVDPKADLMPGQIAVLKVEDEAWPCLRKVRLKGANRMEYVSLNSDYATFGEDEVTVLGRVAIHIRYL